MSPSPDLLTVFVHKVKRKSVRGVKRLIRPFWLRRLRQRNFYSTEPVLAPDGPVVSLTTFEPRFESVFYTLESIGIGVVRPSRLVLWTAHSLLQHGLPPTLERLVQRGLEVRGTEDLGPHTKYFPQVMSTAQPVLPLVTADDDVLYPRDWLQGLTAAAARDPGLIHTYRAHVMTFRPDGRLAPYREWPGCRSTAPSHLHFSTGVSGVLYPVVMQRALRAAGDGFRSCCPRADDVWLKAIAWRERVQVHQVHTFARGYFDVPGTRAHGLAHTNIRGGSNDEQIAQTFTPQELDDLCRLVPKN